MEKTIASIYFDAVEARRPIFGGHYAIPAVPKGAAPITIKIEDRIQLSQEPGPDGKHKVTVRYPVLGEEIAADVMREWTQDLVGVTAQSGPGIWIVRDSLPVVNEDGTLQRDAMNRPLTRPATEEERAAMWAEDLAEARTRDANFAEMLIQEGDVLSQDVKQWRMIGPLRKKAARHYGRDRVWLQELKDSDVKACPFCMKMVPINAVKCSCGEVVDVQKYAALIAKRDQALDSAKRGVINPPVQTGKQPTAA